MDTHEGTAILSVTQRLVLPVTPNEKIDDLKCVLHEIDLHAPPSSLDDEVDLNAGPEW